MFKIKNLRPGILIIADAGLKLAPGESRDIEVLTPQAKDAVANELLACTEATSSASAKPETKAAAKSDPKPDTKSETKPKDKTATSGADSKDESKKGKGQAADEEQPKVPEDNQDAKQEDQPADTGQGQLLGTDNASK